MPRNKGRKIYEIGDRPTMYLKKDCPDELVGLLNEQSDITLFLTHAMELFYEKYGLIDCEEILPRKYVFLEGTKKNFNQQPILKPTSSPSTHDMKQKNSNDVLHPTPHVDLPEDDDLPEEVFSNPDNTSTGTDENEVQGESDSWDGLRLDEDPYA